MKRLFPIATVATSLAAVLLVFIPFPLGADPDGMGRLLGLFAIGSVLIGFSIFALRRGLLGSGSLILSPALLLLSMSCIFSIGGDHLAEAIVLASFCVAVWASLRDLRGAA